MSAKEEGAKNNENIACLDGKGLTKTEQIHTHHRQCHTYACKPCDTVTE